MYNLSFYRGKKVFITGHTGFKGSWLTKILLMAGAKVFGYSLKPNTNPSLFDLFCFQNDEKLFTTFADIREKEKLFEAFNNFQPEIVFHLAAQPLVRESYIDPITTYETNVLGTVYVCECVRQCKSVKSFVNVTTDKVYENNDEKNHRFKEGEKLDGFDPYSNSKSCSDIITHSYTKSFFKDLDIPTSTARAGNVIGGGDFSKDRIIPDCVRAAETNNDLVIRNPNATRPYQHVFDALGSYLLIAEKQYYEHNKAGSYNIGPDKVDIIRNEELIKMFNSRLNTHFNYVVKNDNGPHEAAFLSLDNELIKSVFGWRPNITIEDAVLLTAQWYQEYLDNKSIVEISEKQIRGYFEV